MNVESYIEHLKSSPSFMKNVTSWRVLPAREAKCADFPAGLDARLVAALTRRGIERPYIHQRLAMEAALAGEDCVVVTPTASGKTLCYNVPVLNAILQNEADRALYIFPTKALSSDQAAELYSLIEDMGAEVKACTYDGEHPRLCAHGHPSGGPRGGHQPGHAPSGHFAAPRQVGQAL